MEPALKEWFDKTDWVRSTIKPHELGMHIADVLKQRIENLEQKIAKQEAALRLALEALDSYHGYMEPLTTVFGGPRVPAEQSTTGKVEKAVTALRRALEQQPNRALVTCLFDAAAKSGNPKSIELAAQLSGVPPCEKCGYVIQHCRCPQPAEEPVAWIEHGSNEVPSIVVWERGDSENYTPLYTSPPASKPWVGLTVDEVWKDDDAMALNAEMGLSLDQMMELIEWANAKLREKNA